MDKLADRIVGLEGPEVVDVILDAMEEGRSRLIGLEARVDLVELGHDMSDERLMWVSLDERLRQIEAQQADLLAAVQEAIRRLP